MSSYSIIQINNNVNIGINDGYYIYYIDASTNNINITLPDITLYDGVAYRFCRKDNTTNTITISGYSSQLIDGTSSFNLVSFRESREVVSFNQNWFSY
jgi:hypothetical protein